MKFNPTDKSQSIIADIDFLLFGTSATFNSDYSMVDRTRNVNLGMDEAVSELFKADPNFKWDDVTNTDFPIATTDLVASQDQYVMPDKSLVVHRVRVKDRNGKWRTLTPRLRSELSDSELEATGDPKEYYKIDNAVFVSPAPDYGAEDGVELEFQRGANHFETDDTDRTPGFNPQYHQFLSLCAALRYAMANGMSEKASQLSQYKESVRNDMRDHYRMRSPDERPRLRLARQSTRNYGLR